MNDLNCRESRLDDIVRIDIYPASQCSIPVPPTISIQSLVENNLTFSLVHRLCRWRSLCRKRLRAK